MSDLSKKNRLLKVLAKETVTRPPVICSGGMMNAAIVNIMENTGHNLPEAHKDGKLMAELAYDIHNFTGFENFGLPFCMTVEAELLGSEIDYGTLACEPKIAKERFSSVAEVTTNDISTMLKSGRITAILKAAGYLAKEYPDTPVIGNLTGPISTAASIVDPMTFLKELRKDKENSHRVLDYVSNFLLEYAKLMVNNGITTICIGDPTATGEILGPKMFEEYAVTYLNKVIEGIHIANSPVILHICGNMNRVKHLIPLLKSDVISTDALVNLKSLKEEFPQLITMGNLSTYLLESAAPEKIVERTSQLIHNGIDIISPACGLSTSTPLANIQVMTKTVKGR